LDTSNSGVRSTTGNMAAPTSGKQIPERLLSPDVMGQLLGLKQTPGQVHIPDVTISAFDKSIHAQ
jgi:hypothetical protein